FGRIAPRKSGSETPLPWSAPPVPASRGPPFSTSTSATPTLRTGEPSTRARALSKRLPKRLTGIAVAWWRMRGETSGRSPLDWESGKPRNRGPFLPPFRPACGTQGSSPVPDDAAEPYRAAPRLLGVDNQGGAPAHHAADEYPPSPDGTVAAGRNGR